MFNYSDPAQTGALERAGALGTYRADLHSVFRRFGRTPRSAFTIPEAFEEVADPSVIQIAPVTWLAFPRIAQATAAQIDSQRLRHQDEYVEWRTARKNGRVSRVTFTTEFSEYFEALAAVSDGALLAEIHKITGSNRATIVDVFGPGFNPANATPQGRATRMLQQAARNPWNNGNNDILFLTHSSSTLGALLGLGAACGIPNANVAPPDLCAAVGGACVPGRNSDPAVCSAVQRIAIAGNSFTFVDPVGITIERLEGIWKLGGQQIDINASNLWQVSRNRRRATLEVPADLTLVDDPIDSGTAVATRLLVGARVMLAPDAALPEWSRMGQESSRMFTD